MNPNALKYRMEHPEIYPAKLHEDSSGIIVHIDQNRRLVSFKDRKKISDPRGEYAQQGLWRAMAGGVLHIYHQGSRSFIALPLRDQNAPNYPGHLTICSGLSYDLSSVFNLRRLALFHGLSEVAVTVDNRLIFPELVSNYEGLLSILTCFAKARLKDLSVETDGQASLAKSACLPARKSTSVLVESEHHSSHENTLCVVDQNTRAIDTVYIIETRLPKGKTVFVDCEDCARQPIDREIYIFDLGHLRMVEKSPGKLRLTRASTSFKTGKEQESTPDRLFPMTPVLEHVLDALLY